MNIITFVVFGFILTNVRSQQSFCKPTNPDTLGPYWMNGAPVRNGTLCENQKMLNTLVVSGRVLDEECRQGVHAVIDVWQADERGEYSDGKYNFACRAKIRTDPQGNYRFATIYPARYLQGDSYRPAHIHFMVGSVDIGGYGTFVTQMYFKNDTYLGANDSCGPAGVFCNSGDTTRQMEFKVGADSRTLEVTFNIVLAKKWRKH